VVEGGVGRLDRARSSRNTGVFHFLPGASRSRRRAYLEGRVVAAGSRARSRLSPRGIDGDEGAGVDEALPGVAGALGHGEYLQSLHPTGGQSGADLLFEPRIVEHRTAVTAAVRPEPVLPEVTEVALQPAGDVLVPVLVGEHPGQFGRRFLNSPQ
jgi:hypothetical protein